jgi:uncharacterized membrane protein YqjE
VGSGEPLVSLPEPSAERQGLRPAITRVARALVGILSTRAELASVEFTEERERLTQRLALVAGGGLLLAFAALFVGAFVIVLFWDTHRLWAIAAVAVAHLAGGLILLSKAKAIGRDSPSPFAATIDELRKDKELLERALADRED